MINLPTLDQAIATANSEAATLREYAGSDVHRVLLRMLDALQACAMAELATAPLDRVQQLQAHLAQLRAIDAAITSPGGSPRV